MRNNNIEIMRDSVLNYFLDSTFKYDYCIKNDFQIFSLEDQVQIKVNFQISLVFQEFPHLKGSVPIVHMGFGFLYSLHSFLCLQ